MELGAIIRVAALGTGGCKQTCRVKLQVRKQAISATVRLAALLAVFHWKRQFAGH